MGMRKLFLPLILLTTVLTGCVSIAQQRQNGECLQQDFVNRVSASGHCLVLDVYKSPTETNGRSLIVFVHGDGLRIKGGRYVKGLLRMYPESKHKNVVLVALTRPGYSNGKEVSSGDHYYREGDAYREHTVKAVSNAILSLKKHYQAKRLVVIGHSGGANILANGMGMVDGFQPDLAILLSGSYYMEKWAKHRGFSQWYKGRGLSPHEHVDGISPSVKIIALTGEDDRNTLPEFASSYVNKLRKAGKNASFRSVADTDHDGILGNATMWKTLEGEIFGD